MKSSTFIAILLTFLMALLVLVSAVVFLWQGRQQMQNTISGLETEVAMLADAQIRAEANLASESAARATTQADLATRQAEFDRSEQESIALQQEVAALSVELTRVNMTATATPDPAALAQPELFLILEPAGQTPLNTVVDYTILIGHPVGIAQVTLIIGDQFREDYQGNGLRLVKLEESYLADMEGEISFQVVATSTLGVAGSVTSTLTVATPTPTVTPTPTGTPPLPNVPTTFFWPTPLEPGRIPVLAFIPFPAPLADAAGIGG
jgi:hypothetical protein